MLQKMTQMSNQESEKYQKSLKKLSLKYQRILLVAISRGEATPDTLNKISIEFFQTSSSFYLHILLNSLFEENELKVLVTQAVETIFLNVSFLWTDSLTPPGLEASVLTTDYTIKNYLLHKSLVLDYSSK